jgi:hypothetical protein
MIGTTRFMTDANGDEIEPVACTAFGGESRLSRDERGRSATGEASMEARVRPVTCPDGVTVEVTAGHPVRSWI